MSPPVERRPPRHPGASETQATVPSLALEDASGASLRLLVVGDGIHGTYALPDGASLVLGRSSQCDFTVAHASLSRQHARLTTGSAGRALVVEDLGSANGTFVRGRRLVAHEPVDVALGEAIELGEVTIVVQGPGTRADERATVPPPAPSPAPVLPEGHIVRDAAMLRAYALLRRIAAGHINVLILGETGVGKDVAADALHRFSPRASGPFVQINCAALAPTLLEGELFGYEKGAFTGAAQSKAGLLESADGGTVLLDEIGEMPLELQAKLLRVLEDRKVSRIGALRPRPVDVRFVAATHRDLDAEVTAGRFRQDLWYRLNGVSVTLPPLRERPAEIEPLALHFATRSRASLGLAAHPTPVTHAAMVRLRAHAWPGNIRELRNVIERAVLLASPDAIDVEHLPPTTPARSAPQPASPRADAPPAPSGGLRDEMEALERQRILDALERCAGNQTRAAELLGMPRRTLVKRLAAYAIPRPRSPGAGNDSDD